jgi:hypothetical protein
MALLLFRLRRHLVDSNAKHGIFDALHQLYLLVMAIISNTVLACSGQMALENTILH